MKRLIKQSGMGQNYLDKLNQEIIIVYHGTGSENYQNILNNGILESGGNTYQINSVMNKPGMWVTLNKDSAKTYAIQAVNGYNGDNEEFGRYGVVFEFQLNKNDLSDERSGSKFNFESKIPITSDIINSGHAYIIDTNNNSEYMAF